ncbi:hypothetical protein CJ030_MR4G021044 [Morella rubra]|uniref:Small ribosomal subunit protein mS38 n=1 Tax=Morella rubra TaxID=262757 RepID=A0A6A1VZI0_9ROSI|nr:hypothetical protein CJ030_MR4G021044 [Morella rubra]
MAASLVRKLAKNRPSTSIITTHKTQQFPEPIPSLIHNHTHPWAPQQREKYANDTIHFLRPTGTPKVEPTQTLPLFPNFQFGYLLNPVSSTGFERLGLLEAVEFETDDGRTVWADSVKKKRKRKMNKHKYKKLRKRLRRKART